MKAGTKVPASDESPTHMHANFKRRGIKADQKIRQPKLTKGDNWIMLKKTLHRNKTDYLSGFITK